MPESPIMATVVPTVPVVRPPDAPKSTIPQSTSSKTSGQIPTIEPLSDSDAIESPPPQSPSQPPSPFPNIPSVTAQHTPAEVITPSSARLRNLDPNEDIPAAIPVMTPIPETAHESDGVHAYTSFDHAEVTAVPHDDGPNPLNPPSGAIPAGTVLPSIRFKCPSCFENLEVPGETAGQISRCPCGIKIRVPLESSLPRTVSRDPMKNFPKGADGAPYVPTPFGPSPIDSEGYAASVVSVAPKYKAPKKKKRKPKTKKRPETDTKKRAFTESESGPLMGILGGLILILGGAIWLLISFYADGELLYPVGVLILGAISIFFGMLTYVVDF